MKVFVLLSLVAVPLLTLSHTNNRVINSNYSVTMSQQNILKEEAFNLLRTKCNVCHVNKNKRKIFTRDNMNWFAPQIKAQVFIKRRMPKGKNNQLTEKEYQILSNWIKSLNEQQ